MNKQSLRKTMLALRDSLDRKYTENASAAIAERFMENWGGFKSYMLYCSVRNEVDTEQIAKALWEAGKTVLFPRVHGNSLVPGVCTCMDELVSGYMGVKEPCITAESRSPQVVVVPAVAYDKGCFRLGFGKGYYDRYLADKLVELAVGIAYQKQIVDTTYHENHDQPVDAVLTESSVYLRSK